MATSWARAFERQAAPVVMLGSNLSETQRNSDAPNRSTMWEGA
jgi:hypothetical protein